LGEVLNAIFNAIFHDQNLQLAISISDQPFIFISLIDG